MTEEFGLLPKGYKLLEYEFQDILGRGGFGITYLAIDLNLNKKVAIKEYFPREFANREVGHTIRPSGNKEDRDTFEWGLKRFLDEARTLALFEDPNIISVKRFFEANGTAYLVMDYCDGLSLDEVIKRDGPLDENRLKLILIPLMASLEKIHSANFLHRDVKPANIYIKKDGSPILLDFGSARQHISSHSRTVTSLATAGYAALEQYSTSSAQGPAVDIYGLAATLYRAITGEKPQDSLDRVLNDKLIPLENSINKGFDIKLLKGIDHGLAVRPENRPQSVAEWSEIFGLRSIVVMENYAGTRGKSINTHEDLHVEKMHSTIVSTRVWLYVLTFIAVLSFSVFIFNLRLNIDSSDKTQSTQPTQVPVKPINSEVTKNEPTNPSKAEIIPKTPKPPINDLVKTAPNNSGVRPERASGFQRGKILGYVFTVNNQYNYAEINITDPDIRVGDTILIDWGEFRVEKISGYKCSVIPIGNSSINIVNNGMYVYKALSN